MIRFVLFGIPVGVDWWFWLMTAMLGGGMSASSPEAWVDVGVWMVVVFISILIHELGHAFAGRKFGADPIIRLHTMGGVTLLPGASFTRKQNIFVSAAGPMAGFALGIVALVILQTVLNLPPIVVDGLRDAVYINFFWTLINLLPIQPMDGGQILRDVLGPSRFKITCTIGFLCAVGVGILAFKVGMYFLAVMLGFMAYLNLQGRRMDGGVVTN